MQNSGPSTRRIAHSTKSLGGGLRFLTSELLLLFMTFLLWGEPDQINSVPYIGSTGVDESLALTFKYNDGRIATLYSSFTVDSTVETHICGTEGQFKMNRWWFCPVQMESRRGRVNPRKLSLIMSATDTTTKSRRSCSVFVREKRKAKFSRSISAFDSSGFWIESENKWD